MYYTPLADGEVRGIGPGTHGELPVNGDELTNYLNLSPSDAIESPALKVTGAFVEVGWSLRRENDYVINLATKPAVSQWDQLLSNPIISYPPGLHPVSLESWDLVSKLQPEIGRLKKSE